MIVKVISIFEKETDPDGLYINTTSKSEKDWQRDLSPFYLGPCFLYGDYYSNNMENGWQYSKVYPEFTDQSLPLQSYFDWAKEGWRNPRAVRYPMGKGRKPLYSWWKGQRLDYIDARKQIYAPLYAKAVQKTIGYEQLCVTILAPKNKEKILYLKDYDAYRHEDLGMTLTDVLNYPKKKMGHAFVLMMLLTNDKALKECDL